MIDATDGEGDGEGGGKLSDSEIIGNAITFMLAAYDTTSSALSYTAYLLALNPQVQKKCQAEIDEYQEKNPVINKVWIWCVIEMFCVRRKPPSTKQLRIWTTWTWSYRNPCVSSLQRHCKVFHHNQMRRILVN